MGFHQFKRVQHINTNLDELWDFISSPNNLSVITPPNMGFNIISENLPTRMYPGMIVAYKVKPLSGIKMTWVTEITHIEEKRYFVDEQRIGPYKLWHHEHILEEVTNGIQMMDIVSYKPPFGLIGSFANSLFIKKQLNDIFNYREEALNNLFSDK